MSGLQKQFYDNALKAGISAKRALQLALSLSRRKVA